MDATYSTQINTAFAVTGEHLKRLCSLLAERIGPNKIELKSANDVSHTFDEIAKVLEWENPKGNAIINLRISARSKEFDKSATVEFRSEFLPGIKIDVSASDLVISRLRSDILDVLAGTRPWFSKLTRFDFVVAGFLIIPIAALISLVLAGFGWFPTREQTPEEKTQSQALAVLVGLGTVTVVLGGGIALNRFWSVIFPGATFLIGQGMQRHEHMEKVRWGVVIAFVVSLAAGLVLLPL